MSDLKYFVAKSPTGEILIHTTTASLATTAALASSGTPILASDDAIVAYIKAGGTLHPSSAEEGGGKMFLLPAELGAHLVRAKNAADALIRVMGGTIEVRKASQDDLVRLLLSGVHPIEWIPTPKAEKPAQEDVEPVSA